MATQNCPKCKHDSFTWRMDDEISDLTIWGCGNCGYEAFEDESNERKCANCQMKTQSKLKDREMEYWWCSNCDNTKAIYISIK